MCQSWIRPVRVKAASTRARIIEAAWVATMILCLLRVSARLPPAAASSKTGIWAAKPTMPRSTAEPLRR